MYPPYSYSTQHKVSPALISESTLLLTASLFMTSKATFSTYSKSFHISYQQKFKYSVNNLLRPISPEKQSQVQISAPLPFMSSSFLLTVLYTKISLCFFTLLSRYLKFSTLNTTNEAQNQFYNFTTPHGFTTLFVRSYSVSPKP